VRPDVLTQGGAQRTPWPPANKGVMLSSNGTLTVRLNNNLVVAKRVSQVQLLGTDDIKKRYDSSTQLRKQGASHSHRNTHKNPPGAAARAQLSEGAAW
jgi:hypothetical protein